MRRRAGALLGLLAVGAIAIGLAAILLLPPSSPSAPPGGPGTFSGTSVSLVTGGEVIAILAAGLGLLLLYMRFTGPGGVVPKRFLTLVLVYFLISISFLALVHLLGLGGLSGLTPTNATTNQTGMPVNSTYPANQTSVNSSAAYHQAVTAFWWVVAGAIGISVAGLVVAVWYLGRPVAEAPKRSQRDRVGQALEKALRALDGATDPRAVLIALYAQLLVRIGGSLGELDVSTPREIERACVEELGIPAGPSAELRALFERARYSTLPMTEDDVVRARAALHDALEALRPSVPGPR